MIDDPAADAAASEVTPDVAPEQPAPEEPVVPEAAPVDPAPEPEAPAEAPAEPEAPVAPVDPAPAEAPVSDADAEAAGVEVVEVDDPTLDAVVEAHKSQLRVIRAQLQEQIDAIDAELA